MKPRPAFPSGWVATRRRSSLARRLSKSDHTRWRQSPRRKRNQKIGLLTRRHHHPARVKETWPGEASAPQNDTPALCTLRSEASDRAMANARQMTSARRESRRLSAVETASAAGAKEEGARSGARVN